MFEKLDTNEKKYEELSRRMSEPEALKDKARYLADAKLCAELEPMVEAYREFKGVEKEILEAEKVLRGGDPELKQLASDEREELQRRREELLEQLRGYLVPRDPNDEKNVILEVRAGTGGEEAALFAQDLFRMYSRYVERKGWKLEVLDISPSELGGLKEVIATIEGKSAYSRLRFESGVHRVQRVPRTEASGRIHTSTATVAVLPEAEEVDVEIKEKDLRIDRFCSTGPGGQSVNTTYSAIRITHIPTGLVVQCQDEKSQHKNKAKALRVLRSRLLEIARQEQHDSIAKDRRTQIGSGDRSEKIRTYNFPQGRVSDHRINLTIHQIESILDGNLDQLIDPLTSYHQGERLKAEAGVGSSSPPRIPSTP
ncbi:MAG TPA: peptide chain release factor 1 [Candidatus Polarisedimenticolia bacterium]|nr:peptide chain release factor 1 [Candidatus Polarisedimenticolia bacterium]